MSTLTQDVVDTEQQSTVTNGINPMEYILVVDSLQKRGITNYTIAQGNKCVWVTHYRRGFAISDYYIFRDGRIVDIITD